MGISIDAIRRALKRRLPEVLFILGVFLVLGAFAWLSQTGPDAGQGRRIAGWTLALGMALMMTGISAWQYAQLDRQPPAPGGDPAAHDRAATADALSASGKRPPAWQLWRHW